MSDLASIRQTLIVLREIYMESAPDSRKRKAVSFAMQEITEGIFDHHDIFPDQEWDHPCLCDECKSCAM